MTSVAFIGLGIMGGPMAANLVKAGYEVVGYNRSPERVQRLVEAGGRGADDVAGAVRDADVVISMVPDSPDVEAVTGGRGRRVRQREVRRAVHRHEHHPARRGGTGQRGRSRRPGSGCSTPR